MTEYKGIIHILRFVKIRKAETDQLPPEGTKGVVGVRRAMRPARQTNVKPLVKYCPNFPGGPIPHGEGNHRRPAFGAFYTIQINSLLNRPAVWAASTTSRRPLLLARAPISSTGISVPVTELCSMELVMT